MIGLEYVLKLWNITQQELADKLEIKQQNIDSWIKGKRKIPKKHLPKLVEIFNIPEKYFQKELKFYDEERIQLMKLYETNDEKELGYGVVDTEWVPNEEFLKIQEENMKKQMIEFNFKREELIEIIQKTIDLDLGNTKYSPSIISSQIYSKNTNLNFIKTFLEVFNNCQGHQKKVLELFFIGFKLLQNNDLSEKVEEDIDQEKLKFIYKVRDLIKQEEKKLRIKDEIIRKEIEKYNHYD
ncbi:helix-turn-helix transcriptional regulator [Clostridium botulinum]|nr:helix-turn-helix transcriptional regulator [Clostridium botulinum]NFH71472.1 helix-turn-helix transcriptional regulator [Clostridium botulinum]NFI79775.1 helix-turn-helix transcriptional regulator [Clostridium botulinum]NFJ70916.1 helix-turn-helix transcriptional regulator [Clostridium botulinum]NFM10027.1 helix-turn-helix transcriptional regulator [Clostridium botulinum]